MTCAICQERPATTPAGNFCKQCARSYDRTLDDCGILPAILWAANRARWFERRRWQRDRKGS